MTGRRDRNWLRLDLTKSDARLHVTPQKRAPVLQQESELKAEADDSPLPVLEDEVPVEVEFSGEELSSIPSGEEAEEVSREDSIGDNMSVEVSEFSVEELSLVSSGRDAEEGLPEDGVGDEGEVDDDQRSSSVEGRGRGEGVNAEPGRKGSGRWGVKKVSIFLFFAVISLIGSVSVVGLLQSSESVGSSGIVVQSPPPPPPAPAMPSAPPPEPKIDIDVYSDWECTVSLTRVEWGSVEAGRSVDRVVYVKNAGDYGVVLSLFTDGWDPANAAEHMDVSWDYDGGPIGAGAVVEIVLTLSVEASTSVLGGFSFDIVFIGLAS